MHNSHVFKTRSLALATAFSLLAGCGELGQILGPQASPSPSATPTASPTVLQTPSSLPTSVPTSLPTPLPTVSPTAGPGPASPPGTSQPVGSGFVDQAVESVLVPSKFVAPATALSGSGNGNGSLSLSKNYFKPGKPIALNFIAGQEFSASAWIGILPAEIAHGQESLNDQHDLTFQGLNNQSRGQLNFGAPGEEKAYDFRMHGSDSGGPEAASVAFVVTRELPPEETALSRLRLSKDHYKPGSKLLFTFSAPASFDDEAWVGIVPANVPHGEESVNDQHDQAFHYLRGRTSGDLEFTAPAAEGRYELRLHDTNSNGKEACYAAFTVTRELPAAEIAASSLSLDQTTYARGASMRVRFTAPASFDKTAWVGIIPSDISHGEEALNDQHDQSFQSLDGKTGGELVFTAPPQPGRYDLRLHDTNNNGKEAVYISFTVAE